MTARIALAAALVAAIASPALAQDVTVTLTGVQSKGGHLVASLASPSTFMLGQPEYSVRADGDATGSVTVTFRDVAPGDYALMVMHDANDNNQFDWGMAGNSEGYAFSNLSGPLMGMPAFADHKVAVGQQGLSLTVAMNY